MLAIRDKHEQVEIHTFFIGNTFIRKTRLKLANAKQHPKAELLLFENYSHSSSSYYPKIIGHYLINKQENNCISIHKIMQLII